MQYYQVEKLVEIFQSIKNTPISNIQNSMLLLELQDIVLPIEQRRLILVNKLIEQYGKKNEQNDFEVKPNSENYFEFIRHYNILQATEVKLNLPTGLTIQTFDNLPLTLDQLQIIKSIF